MSEQDWLLLEQYKALGRPEELQKIRSGKWVGVGYDGYADGCPVYDEWECSECRYEHNGAYDTLTAYCPDCGAQMEVEVEVGAAT